MVVNTITFQLDNKYHYIKSVTNNVDGLNNEELERLKSKVTLLGMKSGMFRFSFCRHILLMISVILFFICFMLILPAYINYGKAQALLMMSAMLFFIALPFCWNYTQPCRPTGKLRKTLMHKFGIYVYSNQAEIYKDFAKRGWELDINSNSGIVRLKRILDTPYAVVSSPTTNISM